MTPSEVRPDLKAPGLIDPKGIPGAEDYGPLDDILQLTNVSRPRIKHRIGLFPLRKEGFSLFTLDYRPPYACFGQELNWAERGLLCPVHRQAFQRASLNVGRLCALSKRCSLSGNQNSRLVAREILGRL